jgi:hypothetical protein
VSGCECGAVGGMIGVWDAVGQALKFNSEMALLKRAIGREVETPLAKKILAGEVEQKFKARD